MTYIVGPAPAPGIVRPVFIISDDINRSDPVYIVATDEIEALKLFLMNRITGLPLGMVKVRIQGDLEERCFTYHGKWRLIARENPKRIRGTRI